MNKLSISLVFEMQFMSVFESITMYMNSPTVKECNIVVQYFCLLMILPPYDSGNTYKKDIVQNIKHLYICH